MCTYFRTVKVNDKAEGVDNSETSALVYLNIYFIADRKYYI